MAVVNGLNLKCPLEGQALSAWPAAHGSPGRQWKLWEGEHNGRKLVPWGHALEGHTETPPPLPSHHEVSSSAVVTCSPA